MATLILVFAALVMWHWIYQSLLLPTIRVNLRFELFKLRDRLRWLKANNPELDEEVFRVVQSSINNSIKFLPVLDLATFSAAQYYFENDLEIKEKIIKRTKMLNDCPVEDLQKIRRDIFNKTRSVIVLNSGGWLPYLIPIVYVIAVLGQIKSFVNNLTAISEYELQKIVPQERLACAN